MTTMFHRLGMPVAGRAAAAAIHRSCLAAACLLGAGGLVAGAPAVASARPLSVAKLPAFTGAASGAPASASTGTSGGTNHAGTSNFHPNLANPNLDAQALLPLEQLPADAVSVPTWSGSFTTDGTTYPFTMVGTDPTGGSVTTHVPVEIIPLSLDFAGSGCVLADSAMTADIEASPLFAPTALPEAGGTQYLDDHQRANFWSTVSTVSPGYHLLLDPSDIPAVTLHVPCRPRRGLRTSTRRPTALRA
jgi:hypothetical protein